MDSKTSVKVQRSLEKHVFFPLICYTTQLFVVYKKSDFKRKGSNKKGLGLLR